MGRCNSVVSLRNGSEELVIDNPQTLRSSRFKRSNPLKVLIHGYKRNGWSDFPHIVKDGESVLAQDGAVGLREEGAIFIRLAPFFLT